MNYQINVRDFGARADGITDDAPAIQQALDFLAPTGGELRIPSGTYRMKSGVRVPVGVNVIGDTPATTGPWQNFLDSQDKGHPIEPRLGAVRENWLDPTHYRGTWILCDHGAGEENSGATFELSGNTGVFKMGFVNVLEPPITDTFVKCPPCIALTADKDRPYTREGVTVEDVSLANCCYGIVLQCGKELENDYPGQRAWVSCGRHRIHNIMGGPIYRGILLKGLLDTVDVTNVQFNYSCYDGVYVRTRAAICIDFQLMRGDGILFSDCLSFGALIAFRTLPAYGGTCSLRLINSNFESAIPLCLHASGVCEVNNCYFLTVEPCNVKADSEYRCIEVLQDPTVPHEPFYAFTNCVMQCAEYGTRKDGTEKEGGHLLVRLTGNAHFLFNNCQVWGCDGKTPIIRFEQEGETPSSLNINHTMFISGGVVTKPSQMTGVLASVGGKGYRAGDLCFSGCRIPSGMYNGTDTTGMWFDRCIITDDTENRCLDTMGN